MLFGYGEGKFSEKDDKKFQLEESAAEKYALSTTEKEILEIKQIKKETSLNIELDNIIIKANNNEN